MVKVTVTKKVPAAGGAKLTLCFDKIFRSKTTFGSKYKIGDEFEYSLTPSSSFGKKRKSRKSKRKSRKSKRKSRKSKRKSRKSKRKSRKSYN